MTFPHPEFGGSKRPGQMTAAMRASTSALGSSAGPKRLRIGVVHDGRMRDERTLKSPDHVSVGTNEDNTFLLGGSAHPTSFRLFERIDESYRLNLTDDMQGRIALARGVFDLSELQKQARRDGASGIALTDEARGKVVLGDVTFLFHFVEPSPVLPKAVLPVAVLRGPRSVDWNSTICAAFSFLFHFMLLGAVYSDWADPVVDDDLSTAGLVDSLKNLPPPPPVEDKSAPEDPPTPIREDPPQSQVKSNEVRPTKREQNSGRTSPVSRAADRLLADQLAQINMSVIGVFGNNAPATSIVTAPREVAWTRLDDVAPSAAGVGSGPNDLLVPSAGRPVARTTLPAIRDVGTTTLGPGGSGRAASVSGPKADANIASPSTIGGAVSDAARVVAGMRAGFRACYQRGLNDHPDASGSIRLTIRVGAGGEVTGVTASPSGNLPAAVVSCVQARVQASQFASPEGGSAVIQVPVTFVKQ